MSGELRRSALETMLGRTSSSKLGEEFIQFPDAIHVHTYIWRKVVTSEPKSLRGRPRKLKINAIAGQNDFMQTDDRSNLMRRFRSTRTAAELLLIAALRQSSPEPFDTNCV